MEIILICYTFPPDSGIGGKRWYNLGKELAQHQNIHLITFSYGAKKNDFKSITHLKSNFPKILTTQPQSKFSRINYGLQNQLRKRKTNGYHLDRAATDKNKLIKAIKHIHHKFNSNCIITSGGPFSLLYNVLDLKQEKKFRNVLFVSDIRDPWCWDDRRWFKNLDSLKKKYEKLQERKVIETSDLILVPSTAMQCQLISKYGAIPVHHIEHGFDLTKISKSLKITPEKNNSSIKLIYGGSWYEGIDEKFIRFCDLLNNAKHSTSFQLYSNRKVHLHNLINSNQNLKNIYCSDYIEESILFREIRCSDYFVIIIPKEFKDYLSSKYLEIFALETPIIFLGDKGLVSDYIEKHGFGFHVAPSNISNVLNILNNKLAPSKSSNVNIRNSSFQKIALKISTLLENSIKK